MTRRNIIKFWLAAFIIPASLCAGADDSRAKFCESVKALCRDYLAGFGSSATHLCYHHRLDGPKGSHVLTDPSEIAKGTVKGESKPFGYGSGIQDVALENGQLLFALCDAHDATQDSYFADTARWIFAGLKKLATLSPEPGFVPRGPHPDGKSYYRDSSRDQHCAYIEALWRYFKSPLSSADDRAFIGDTIGKIAARMERNDWVLKVEDNSRQAHVGFTWKQITLFGASSLMSCLAAAKETTAQSHWAELYEKFGSEKEGLRWKILSVDSSEKRQAFTLYSNQFITSLVLIARTETNAARATKVRDLIKSLAQKALASNVFDETSWRRLDWAGESVDAKAERALDAVHLSLQRPATVFDLIDKFDAAMFVTGDRSQRSLYEKLLFGIPTVAFHKALLSEHAPFTRQVDAPVRKMVELMREHGKHYEMGENFNRTVILGLHLLACTK